MNDAIKVNGQTMKVLNSWSAGPGTRTHTFQVPGAYVENYGNVWKIQRPGQFAQIVTVDVG